MLSKTLAVIGLSLLLSACSVNPPKPVMPKGDWVQMNIQVPAAQAQLKKINSAKGGK